MEYQSSRYACLHASLRLMVLVFYFKETIWTWKNFKNKLSVVGKLKYKMWKLYRSVSLLFKEQKKKHIKNTRRFSLKMKNKAPTSEGRRL